MGRGNIEVSYETVKSTQEYFTRRVRNENEELLFCEAQITKRWKKYIDTPYYDETVVERAIEM